MKGQNDFKTSYVTVNPCKEILAMYPNKNFKTSYVTVNRVFCVILKH